MFRRIMDEIIKLQELRAAELNRLVVIQHDQVEMLKSLLKVRLWKNVFSSGHFEKVGKDDHNYEAFFRNKKMLMQPKLS